MQHSVSGFAGSSGMLSLATAHATALCPFHGEVTAAQAGGLALALSFGPYLLVTFFPGAHLFVPISWSPSLATHLFVPFPWSLTPGPLLLISFSPQPWGMEGRGSGGGGGRGCSSQTDLPAHKIDLKRTHQTNSKLRQRRQGVSPEV